MSNRFLLFDLRYVDVPNDKPIVILTSRSFENTPTLPSPLNNRMEYEKRTYFNVARRAVRISFYFAIYLRAPRSRRVWPRKPLECLHLGNAIAVRAGVINVGAFVSEVRPILRGTVRYANWNRNFNFARGNLLSISSPSLSLYLGSMFTSCFFFS